MTRGISINIGVNNLSDHYDAAVFGTLKSCINDANEMATIAKFMGFEKPIVLHDQDATVAAVKTHIRNAAVELKSGDICLITFSGHGGQYKDDDLDETDDRQMDETWCLHNKQLIDDEFWDLWTDFKEGVRVLVVSDSCHSGTIIDRLDFYQTNVNRFLLLSKGFDFRSLENLILYENGLKFIKLNEVSLEKNFAILEKIESISFTLSDAKRFKFFEQNIKTLPRVLLQKIFSDNKKIYNDARLEAKENLQKKLRDSNKENFRDLKRSSILLISACQDWQTTKDGKNDTDNSVFTKAFCEVWDNGNFSKSYIEFHEAISKKLEAEGRKQVPNFYMTGKTIAAFKQQKPFTVEFQE